MKRDKIIYWVTTAIVGLMMLASAVMYMTQASVKEGFQQMGFPDFFRVELGVAKGLAGIALLVPMVPRSLKVIAYVGLLIVFVSAMIAHIAIGDAPGAGAPLFFLLLLGGSYWAYNRVYHSGNLQAA